MGRKDSMSPVSRRCPFMRRAGKVINGLAFSAMVLAVIAGCSRKPSEPPLLPEGKTGEDVLLGRLREQWRGDLDEILRNRRVIRVLVSYGKTNFAIAKGRPQVLEYELLHDYEISLGKEVGRHHPDVQRCSHKMRASGLIR